jgi:hypothetical protein
MVQPRLLEKAKWTTRCIDLRSIELGAWEYGGYRHYRRYKLADLPNDLVGRDDFERLGIDVIQVARTVG